MDGIACSAYTTDHDDFNTAGGLSPAILPNDPHRVAALMAYDILDSEPEQGIVMGLMTEFDDIVALATAICGTPIAVVTFVACTCGAILHWPVRRGLCGYNVLWR